MRGEFVDVGGLRLYCWASGTRGAGVPVVLVHGAFCSGYDWEDVIARLPRGHRVLVHDLLGHGRSDRGDGCRFTPAAHAERLAALLDLLGVEEACLVGHGLGAATVLALAEARPALATHLALIAPWLVHDPASCPVPPAPLRPVARLRPLWRQLPADWVASALHRALLRGAVDRLRAAHALDRCLMPYRTPSGRAPALAQLDALCDPSAVVPLHGAPGARRDAVADGASHGARTVPLPTLLLTGADDPFIPRGGERLADALVAHPGFDTAVHRLAGHAAALLLDAPDRVATTIAELLAR